MKVKATRLGYYDNLRRREGVVFDLKNPKDFSEKWMSKLKEPKKADSQVDEAEEVNEDEEL
jgi:hypothetical protein